MEELIYQYNILLNLLEEDSNNISRSLQDDLCESYKSLLNMEVEMISNSLNNLYQNK